jgi:hypothetical protein
MFWKKRGKEITRSAHFHFPLPVLLNLPFTNSSVDKPTKPPRPEFPSWAEFFSLYFGHFLMIQKGFPPFSPPLIMKIKNNKCRSICVGTLLHSCSSLLTGLTDFPSKRAICAQVLFNIFR